MSLRINTNISAMNTHAALQANDLAMTKSLEKLSSGLRINRAADDPAGLSISETLRTQVNGLDQAQKNAQDGISLLNTADGALNEISAILQRMRELAVQASNGTLTDTDRAATNDEVQSLLSEIDNITSYTTFNSMKLLDDGMGGAAVTFTFQVGANNGETLVTGIPSTSTGGLTLISGGIPLDTGSQLHAQAALLSLDSAIEQVSTIRSQIGAVSNRLEHTINSISTADQNLAAAESQIRDVDVASEMSNLTRTQILMQSSTAMLSQANAAPQTLLSLFK